MRRPQTSKAKTKDDGVNGQTSKIMPSPKRTSQIDAQSTPALAKKSTAGKSTRSKARKPTIPEKRKSEEPAPGTHSETEHSQRKRQKTTTVTRKVILNKAPTTRLNVYVCGTGNSGELGLGNREDANEVQLPRLNNNLNAATVGVTHLAIGGMHCAAITHDNQILTWGVNDQGALGRDTAWEGGLKEIDQISQERASDTDSEIDETMNPREAVPTPIPEDSFPPGTVFVELAAGDSSTFALTDEGLVYGWGTFRNNEGVWLFDVDTKIQRKPSLITSLKKIKHIACGDNHVLALDANGRVYAWGSGQQNQLGRRIIERLSKNGLEPREFGLPKGIQSIACGSYHSFAVGKDGKVFAWGLNNYGETGVEAHTQLQIQRDEEPTICTPKVVKGLIGKEIVCIDGGAHHSVAVTQIGECLVWGRLDGFQAGIKIDSLPSDAVIKDERGHPRILVRPTANPSINGAVWAAAGSEHCIAITDQGKAFGWGFNVCYQTGVGGSNDVEVARLINAAVVRDQKLIWAGAGGQFSVLASIAPPIQGANHVRQV